MLDSHTHMGTAYQSAEAVLRTTPESWLVTGAAGFIGSHLVEALLRLGQRVTGLDNFATGRPGNLEQVREAVTAEEWAQFQLIQGDIRDAGVCRTACSGIQYILHHAALGSVPASMDDPLATHQVNVTGFVNLLCAARAHGVKRVVYASSSAVYGDDPVLPKTEDRIGKPLSPYAASKLANELDADTFGRCFGLDCIGLRYFNVFGSRQDPEGAYAAVIPKWINAMIRGDAVFINGDGETTRDFCPVTNVVQANILAATAPAEVGHSVFNIAMGERISLNQLFIIIRDELAGRFPRVKDLRPTYRDFRGGDIRHSHADISRARKLLGYMPGESVQAGLAAAMSWYIENGPGA